MTTFQHICLMIAAWFVKRSGLQLVEMRRADTGELLITAISPGDPMTRYEELVREEIAFEESIKP